MTYINKLKQKFTFLPKIIYRLKETAPFRAKVVFLPCLLLSLLLKIRIYMQICESSVASKSIGRKNSHEEIFEKV